MGVRGARGFGLPFAEFWPQTALQVEGLAADPTAELSLLQLPRSFEHLAHLGLRGTTLGANALCAMVSADHAHCNHPATMCGRC